MSSEYYYLVRHTLCWITAPVLPAPPYLSRLGLRPALQQLQYRPYLLICVLGETLGFAK